jgi:hypothetical protein
VERKRRQDALFEPRQTDVCNAFEKIHRDEVAYDRLVGPDFERLGTFG